MASESDNALISSKRPKTKPVVVQESDSSCSKSSNDDEDIVVENKENSAVSNRDVFADPKKAVKRSRESDEESSITSDDEIMSNKRIRKNSDDDTPNRPKKVVSAAARKRREAAKTSRETKIAALGTDSEYDSDENVKCEENISKSKQLNSNSENKVLANSDIFINAEELSFQKNVRKIDKTSGRTCDKNEDSSSAYNSDSQEREHLQNITKRKKVIDLDKEIRILLSPVRETSCTAKKIDTSSNSGSELDENVDGKKVLAANFSIDKEHTLKSTDSNSLEKSNEILHLCGNSPEKNQSVYSLTEHSVSDTLDQEYDSHEWKTQRSSNIHSDTKKEEKTKVADICESNCKSGTKIMKKEKSQIASVLISSSEANSSDDETLKTKTTSEKKDVKVKKQNVIQSSNVKNTFKSSTDNSSEDDQPLNKRKQVTLREENLEEDRLTNQNSDTSDDELHRSLNIEKGKRLHETDSSKISQKTQKCSIDTSDSDKSIVKKKSSQHLKEKFEKKKKVIKPTSKNQYSSEDESSEDEQPLKKTKASSRKVQSISDSEDSSNCFLKTKPKKANNSRSKCQQSFKETSSSDEDKPRKKTSDDIINKNKTPFKHSQASNKQSDFHQLNEKVDIFKKGNGNFKTNDSKSKQNEKKLKKTHISDDLNSSNDDRLSKEKKSSVPAKTKIDGRERVLKQPVKNQNSSDEEISSEDDQPLKKTKSISNKTHTISDSEKSDENISQSECEGVQSSKNRCKQNRKDSDNDSDEPLKISNSALNKKSTETNPKHKRNRGMQSNAKKKGISDSEDDSEDFQKGVTELLKGITEMIEDKNVKSKGSSNISDNESSSNSDVPLAKNSEVKTTVEKSNRKKGSDKASKYSAKSKDIHSSDSEDESVKMKPTKKSSESSSQKKKEIRDSETLVEEENSEDQQNKKGESDATNSDSSSKPLKSNTKHEISDTADSTDSNDDKRKIKESISKKSHKIVEKKSKVSSSESDSDSNSKKEETKKKKKAPSKMDVRISNLKKYIRTAGIRVNNYALIWVGCKSDKQRADKLMKLLEENGMKGRPTLQKCKKLRDKIERKREVEDLDLGNIIDDDEDTGRHKCRSSRRQPGVNRNSVKEKETTEGSAELKSRFSRLKDLVDSDSSSG